MFQINQMQTTTLQKKANKDISPTHEK